MRKQASLDIGVADMGVDIVADMEVDIVADMVADKTKQKIIINIDIDMEIQFGEWVGHSGWLIGLKLFRPKASPARAYSELCEFIILAGFHRAKGQP